MKMFDVAVVGGGISGLWAARLLKKAGASFIVIEARNRLGGRMRTMCPEAGYLEAGAQYVGRFHDYTLMACQAMGLDLIRTHHPRDVPSIWHDGSERTLFTDSPYPITKEVESGSAELEELVLNVRANRQDPWNALLATKLDSVSVQGWMDEYLHEAYVKKLLHDGIRSAFSAEPRDVSLLYFIHYCATAGSFARLMNIGDGAEDFRIAQGTSELARRLGEEIGAENIREGAVVDRIDQDYLEARIHTSQGVVRAQSVIVAMSPQLAARIRYSPELPSARRELAKSMKMGQTIKGFVTYSKPWWREKYSGYALSSSGPVVWTMDNTWRDPKTGEEKLPSLMTFIAGDPAVYTSELSQEERRELVLSQLVSIFDDERARTDVVSPGYVEHDWSTSHWSIGGPGAYFPPGVLTRYGTALREPYYRIHWAGAETGTDWTGGYMNGAIEGAIRAVAEIEHQAELAERPPGWAAVSGSVADIWKREHFGLRRRAGAFLQKSLFGR